MNVVSVRLGAFLILQPLNMMLADLHSTREPRLEVRGLALHQKKPKLKKARILTLHCVIAQESWDQGLHRTTEQETVS